jgi:flagellar biosynthetic protein FliQ
VTQAEVTTLVTNAMLLVAETAGPILAAALVVGLVVSIFQSLTQINDYTLTFVPKLLAVALVIALTGQWMLSQIVGFTDSLYTSLPRMLAGG